MQTHRIGKNQTRKIHNNYNASKSHANFSFSITLAALLCFIFSSCLTPLKIDNKITAYYGQMPALKPGLKPANLKVRTSDAYPKSEYISTTQKPKRKTSFWLLYIREKSQTTTNLHPDVAFNQLANSIHQYARTKTVAERLQGRTVEITIDSLPTQFAQYGQTSVYLLLVQTNRYYMAPANTNNLHVKYAVWGDNQSEKTGSFTVKNPVQSVNWGEFQSYNSLLNEFLTNYDAQLKRVGPEIVNKILQDLD
jgi:hypothetical protein